MSDTMIRVENLSKKYFIGHQQEGRHRYKALRDVITDKAKSFGSKLLKPSGKRMPNLDREEFWALKDISFEIKQGDRVGIIGRNGAGKSTLLKILSRITEPTTGRISVQGRVASLLEVGTGFHPELTGRENIYLNGAILGMSKAEIKKKFDEIVAFAEVERFLDTPVKRFSSGMYVRLAFAVAAHLEPEILVVDEVLAVGDINFQKKCLGKMGEVATKEGRTVLFVSHNMAAVRTLCNTGILLNSGNLTFTGEVNKAVDEYLSKISEPKAKSSKSYGTRFVKVTIQDERGNVVDKLEMGEKNYVIFEVYVENNVDLNLGFTLYNINDIPIISSCALDSFSELPRGFSELKIELPVDLLPSGDYRIEGALWSPYQLYEQDDYLASFSVTRNSYLEVRGSTSRGILVFPDKWMLSEK